MTAGAEGFLLLILPNVHLSAPFARPNEQTGRLSLECVTVPLAKTDPHFYATAGGATGRDVWLVLRVNDFELLISPTEPVKHSKQHYTFLFKAPEGPAVVTLSEPTTLAQKEDIESFEVLLAQYGIIHELDEQEDSKSPTGDDRDLKGRLVLVDEGDGNVVGALDEQFHIVEDPSVAMNPKAPVVMEMPEEGQTQVLMHSVSPEDQEGIFKSAAYVSRGVVYLTDKLNQGVTSASQYYINRTTPEPQPMVFSDTARNRLKRVHKVSGQAVRVTTATTGMIHKFIDRAMDKVTNTPSANPSSAHVPGPVYAPAQDPKGKGAAPPPYGASPTPPPPPPRKPRLLNRILMSTDLIVTTIENSAQTLIAHTTDQLANSLGHKYGGEMAGAVRTVGGTVKNVGVVYIDVRGVGRRVLIKKIGKRAIKGTIQGMRGNKDSQVVIGGDENVQPIQSVPAASPSRNMPGPSSGRWRYQGSPQPSGPPEYNTGDPPYKG